MLFSPKKRKGNRREVIILDYLMLEIFKLLAKAKKKKKMKEITKEDFDLKLLKGLCEDSISRIYGFILYTRRHANVVNFLQNPNYWNCLDDISGPNWPIFSVRPLMPGCMQFKGQGPKGTIGMMIPSWHEPNANRKVLDFFGLQESSDLPCFIGFIWDDSGQLQQFEWKIDDSSVDKVYESLKKVVSLVSDAEASVSEELKSTELLWENVIDAINKEKSLTHMIKVKLASSQAVQLLGSAASIASLVV